MAVEEGDGEICRRRIEERIFGGIYLVLYSDAGQLSFFAAPDPRTWSTTASKIPV